MHPACCRRSTAVVLIILIEARRGRVIARLLLRVVAVHIVMHALLVARDRWRGIIGPARCRGPLRRGRRLLLLLLLRTAEFGERIVLSDQARKLGERIIVRRSAWRTTAVTISAKRSLIMVVGHLSPSALSCAPF